MNIRIAPRQDNQRIGDPQKAQQQDEFRRGLRALLMRPLMAAGHEDFSAVRRQAERLREWFARETGWPLHVDREGARLFKRPANLSDDTRGIPSYDKRRYVLLCLACAVLERADPQITLQLLGERVMQWASEATLQSRDFEFTLRTAADRRDLVAVCRTLLEYGVLQRVAGLRTSPRFCRQPPGRVALRQYGAGTQSLATPAWRLMPTASRVRPADEG